jgi:hypothetical protein
VADRSSDSPRGQRRAQLCRCLCSEPALAAASIINRRQCPAQRKAEPRPVTIGKCLTFSVNSSAPSDSAVAATT